MRLPWWARWGYLCATAELALWRVGWRQFCYPCGDVIVRAGHRRSLSHRRTVREQNRQAAEIRRFVAENPGLLERAAKARRERDRELPSDS